MNQVNLEITPPCSALQKQESDLLIDYNKKLPNAIFFKQIFTSDDNETSALRHEIKQTTNPDNNLISDETNRPILTTNVGIKVRKFANKLKKYASLNSVAPDKAIYLNDMAYFNPIFSKTDSSEKGKNSKIDYFLRHFYMPNFWKNKFMRIFKRLFKPIHPFAKKKILWDIILFLNTLLLFFYIPFTMGFDFMHDDERDVFQRCQFVIYLVDMLINLNTSFIDNGVIIQDRMKVASHYISNFFIWDLLTIISLAGKNDFIPQGINSGNQTIYLQLMFFTKFKLFQVRFNNIKEIFCLDTKLKGFFDLFVLLISTSLFAHFFACMFHFIAITSMDTNNWLNHYEVNKKNLLEQYVWSLYWSTMTMMTVGYGDVVPQNLSEMSFTILTIFVGCIIVGYNINKIGAIFHDMNKETKKIQDNIHKINKFMDSKKINADLQMRIRAYLKFVWQKQNEKLNHELLNIIDCLSDPLKEELYLFGYGDIIRSYSLFSNNFSFDFLSSLLRHMQEQTFMKNDLILEENDISKHNLYFLISGEIEIFRKLSDDQLPVIIKKLKANESFGEYSFLTGLNNTYSARASTYTQVYTISHESFLGVMNNYPKDYEKYCEIRDKIKLYRKFDEFNLRCIICNNKDHMNDTCTLMNYIPNKENLLLKYLFTENQERKFYKRKSYLNYNNALKNLMIITDKAKSFKNIHPKSHKNVNDNDDSLSDDSVDSDDLIESDGFYEQDPSIIKSQIQESKISKAFSNSNSITESKRLFKKLTTDKKTTFDRQISKSRRGLKLEKKMTDNKNSSFYKIREIQPDDGSIFFNMNEENIPINRNSVFINHRQTKILNDKKMSFCPIINFDLELDCAKKFNNYFTDGNLQNFVKKYHKIKRFNSRKNTPKREIILGNNLSLKSKFQKPGYALLNKSFDLGLVDGGKKTRKSHSDTEKNDKKKNKFGMFRLNASHSFFQKMQFTKQKTFMEVLKDVKEHKKK